jgi:UDP-N-acetylmuramyl pentapeptide synthase|tara:strand:+ start:82 stop:1044 length:963 start_codon:yes stop_codon:yes gene_type:complete
MVDLAIGQLADIVDGRLRLGSLPPLGGELEPVGRIVTEAARVGPGDVYWSVDHYATNFSEHVFFQGAAGVVAAGRHIEPWAGKFSVQVHEANDALWQLAAWGRSRFAGTVIAVAGRDAARTSAIIRHVLGRRMEMTPAPAITRQPAQVAVDMLDLDPHADCGLCPHIDTDDAGIFRSISLVQPHVMVCTERALAGTLPALPDDAAVIVLGDERVHGDNRTMHHAVHSKGAGDLIWVGQDADHDFKASDIQSSAESLTFRIEDQTIAVRGGSPSDVPAVLAAFAVGRLLGLDNRDILSGLWSASTETNCSRRAASSAALPR